VLDQVPVNPAGALVPSRIEVDHPYDESGDGQHHNGGKNGKAAAGECWHGALTKDTTVGHVCTLSSMVGQLLPAASPAFALVGQDRRLLTWRYRGTYMGSWCSGSSGPVRHGGCELPGCPSSTAMSPVSVRTTRPRFCVSHGGLRRVSAHDPTKKTRGTVKAIGTDRNLRTITC
jgi:hypothetical protein